MWVILLIAFIEYAAISIFITIDPYASKGNKRGKRLVKMLIWLITAVVVNYLMKENGDYKIYLMIACFFAIKHFLEIINPYLEHMFFTATVYAVIGYLLWCFWYEKHPIIVCGVILLLVCAALTAWKDWFVQMRQGLDADIESEEHYQEEMKKKKRKKALFKFARIAFKTWRM